MPSPVSSSSSHASIDPRTEAKAYALLLKAVRKQFTAVASQKKGKVSLFMTKASNLFPHFLDNLPISLRQEYACSACQGFMERYGGMVTIASDGKTIPVMWDPESVPALYVEAVSVIAAVVARSPIDNVFLSDEQTWGIPTAGSWHHLSIIPSKSIVFKPSVLRTTKQVVAEKKQDYKILSMGLEEFPLEVVQRAYSLLTTESLYRSEKCIEIARWLVNLHEQRQSSENLRFKENITWLAVANAPSGYCHIRSAMIGTLLEDIMADLPFALIKSRFDSKMHPLQYQRATAPPADGNIAQAEKIFDKLKTSGSLERRFAKLADVQALWSPIVSQPTVKKKGLFSHLRTSTTLSDSPMEVSPITMTWDKFSRTVLPTAKTIEYFIPASNQPYMALVTAKNLDAPPIIQWDFEDNRNPVTWYFHANKSPASQWNLRSGVYHPVTAIVLQPSMWNEAKIFAHHGEKVFFILKNAKDKEHSQGGGFFTEFLKSDYYEVRSTLEAHANRSVIEGKDEAEACGIGLAKGSAWDQVFRVTSKDNLQVVYNLDRWD